jgi:hypothetical protein
MHIEPQNAQIVDYVRIIKNNLRITNVSGFLKDRFWPFAAIQIYQILTFWTSAIGKEQSFNPHNSPRIILPVDW